MAESTLSGAYADFREKTAFHLGYGRTSTSWDTDQTATLLSVLKSGLRNFYQPPVLPGESSAHVWSFLHPEASLTIGATTGTVSGVPVYVTTSAVTATTAVFESRMVDSTITFDTSGTAYTIATFVSTTEITVTGDASGETSDDGITISAQYIYDLPDKYGDIIGGFTYNTNTLYSKIFLRAEWQIREMRRIDTTGVPEYCAIRPMTSDGTDGQRFEVMFYPTPNSSYTLGYKYVILMDLITSGAPYPWGGQPHTETIIASCLASAEQEVEDGGDGGKKAYFMERLKASVDHDRNMNCPDTLGFNSDPSIYAGVNRDRLRGVYTPTYTSI